MVRPFEWRWAALVAVGVMAFTTVPYVAAALGQGSGWVFSGALLAVEDGNSYIADMLQGARGAWLFTLPYSSEPHPPVLFFVFYLLLGRLAGPAHASLVVAFHVARFAAGAALLLVAYRFLAEFLPRVSQRRLGLLLVALGGGLGWLLTLLLPAPLYGSLPVDFISPEAFTFLVLFGLPHLALARCLFLLGLLAFLHRRGVAAGLAWLGMGLLQPLYVPVAWLIVAADLLLSGLVGPGARLGLAAAGAPAGLLARWRPALQQLPVAAPAVLLSAPMLLYAVFAFSTDPVLAQWNAQNRLPSPHPVHYLLAFGAWLAPAAVGWRALRRSQPRLARLVMAWLLLAPLLLYLPIPTQRRLIEAIHLPLAALAVLGLTSLAAHWRALALAGLLALVTPTALLIWLGAFAAALRPAEPIFLPAGQARAFHWLARHASPGEVTLAAYETGNALPAYAPLVAYIGHGPETLHLEAKRPRVARFYQAATPDSERLALLSAGRIRYVLHGPREQALGDFDPAAVDYLRLQYSASGYAVYTVVP